MTLTIPFHALFCWMRIERVQQASECSLGSKAGPRRPFKLSNCVLALWTSSIHIQRYNVTKWNRASVRTMLVSVPQTHLSRMWVFKIVTEIEVSGADPGFSFRGGAKDYVPARILWAQNRTHFRQGSRSHLRALEALGLFYCSLVLSEPYFKVFW